MTITSPEKTPLANGSATLAERADIRLLIVDDETGFRDAARSYFTKLGYQVGTAEDGREALNMLDSQDFHVAVVDMHMPHLSGLEFLRQLHAQESNMQIIMLTGGGTIENAVDSMKNGAFDFLTKPAKLNELDLLIQKAYRARTLLKENQQLRAVIEKSRRPNAMIGESTAMQQVRRLIEKTAQTDKPVLIEGESGTGKELVARAIHDQSALANRPLVVINCAALPEPLLESELFGHEKGAFTGASSAKPGLFEIADGGTLFIDEFGDLAGSLQAKLLRVLEDGSLRRVGSVKERHVKVRIIAATNRDLGKEVAAGRFREDLYYRINVLGIRLPPLREREGDTGLLIDHFLGPDWKITDEVKKVLTTYSWPGNVRQLQNALDRAKILSEDDQILLENLPAEIISGSQQVSVGLVGSKVDLESLNRMHVEEVYRKFDRNKTRTAQALGIGRRSLYRLLEKYGIE
ncbi:MAG: sigma-54-dependent Fis family transcriptional regulator [Pirellulaceae bacterium]|jgi:DNA-binding NtrC family response regulator|nr:sigma-54-dependent Fis family transcriptional regulator [Pirellulaceae bacterium]